MISEKPRGLLLLLLLAVGKMSIPAYIARTPGEIRAMLTEYARNWSDIIVALDHMKEHWNRLYASLGMSRRLVDAAQDFVEVASQRGVIDEFLPFEFNPVLIEEVTRLRATLLASYKGFTPETPAQTLISEGLLTDQRVKALAFDELSSIPGNAEGLQTAKFDDPDFRSTRIWIVRNFLAPLLRLEALNKEIPACLLLHQSEGVSDAYSRLNSWHAYTAAAASPQILTGVVLDALTKKKMLSDLEVILDFWSLKIHEGADDVVDPLVENMIQKLASDMQELGRRAVRVLAEAGQKEKPFDPNDDEGHRSNKYMLYFAELVSFVERAKELNALAQGLVEHYVSNQRTNSYVVPSVIRNATPAAIKPAPALFYAVPASGQGTDSLLAVLDQKAKDLDLADASLAPIVSNDFDPSFFSNLFFSGSGITLNDVVSTARALRKDFQVYKIKLRSLQTFPIDGDVFEWFQLQIATLILQVVSSFCANGAYGHVAAPDAVGRLVRLAKVAFFPAENPLAEAPDGVALTQFRQALQREGLDGEQLRFMNLLIRAYDACKPLGLKILQVDGMAVDIPAFILEHYLDYSFVPVLLRADTNRAYGAPNKQLLSELSEHLLKIMKVPRTVRRLIPLSIRKEAVRLYNEADDLADKDEFTEDDVVVVAGGIAFFLETNHEFFVRAMSRAFIQRFKGGLPLGLMDQRVPVHVLFDNEEAETDDFDADDDSAEVDLESVVVSADDLDAYLWTGERYFEEEGVSDTSHAKAVRSPSCVGPDSLSTGRPERPGEISEEQRYEEDEEEIESGGSSVPHMCECLMRMCGVQEEVEALS